jgi:hypothetical protein
MSSVAGLLVAGSVSGAGDFNDGHADLLTPHDAFPFGVTLRVYAGGPGGHSAQPALVIDPPGAIPARGRGDVNGDGLDGFILSSNNSDGTGVTGRACVFLYGAFEPARGGEQGRGAPGAVGVGAGRRCWSVSA